MSLDSATYFATQIFEAPTGTEALRAELEVACWHLEEEDVAGNNWCDAEGYDGYTSYASLEDLPTRLPPFAELKDEILGLAHKAAKQLHWDLADRTLVVDHIWVNILGEGGSHSGHIHPGSVLSGTYYVSVPENSGKVKLEDPRLSAMMAEPPLMDDAPESVSRFIYRTPKPKHILLWPSWLRHEVVSGRTEDPRISISFNIALA